MKNKKIIIATILIVVISITSCIVYKHNKGKYPMGVKSSITNSKTVTETNKRVDVKTDMYYVKGEKIVSKPIKFSSTVNDVYDDFFNLMAKNYKNSNTITIPDNVTVQNYKVDMGTLYLNFDSSAAKIKFKNNKDRILFVKSLIKSYLALKVGENKYEDVQFLQNSKISNNVFGKGFDTKNPIKIK